MTGKFIRFAVLIVLGLQLISVITEAAIFSEEWRNTYDKLFFSGRDGISTPEGGKRSKSPERQLKELITKMSSLLKRANKNKSEIPEGEIEFASSIMGALDNGKACDVDAKEKMNEIREMILESDRRKELYEDNPPEGLLLDQHMEDVVKQQLDACIQRLLMLRHLSIEWFNLKEIGRINRLYRISTDSAVKDKDEEEHLIDEMAKDIFEQCPARSTSGVDTLSPKSAAQRFYRFFFIELCNTLTDLHEDDLYTRFEQTDIESTIDAYRNGLLEERPELSDFIGKRDLCQKYDDFEDMFDRVYERVEEMRDR